MSNVIDVCCRVPGVYRQVLNLDKGKKISPFTIPALLGNTASGIIGIELGAQVTQSSNISFVKLLLPFASCMCVRAGPQFRCRFGVRRRLARYWRGFAFPPGGCCRMYYGTS